MTNPCRIIGVLDNGIEGLAPDALAYVRDADLIIGGTRTLALLDGERKATARMQDLTGRLALVPDWIAAARARGSSVVVLATGDPLCHGIAAYLRTRLPPEPTGCCPMSRPYSWPAPGSGWPGRT